MKHMKMKIDTCVVLAAALLLWAAAGVTPCPAQPTKPKAGEPKGPMSQDARKANDGPAGLPGPAVAVSERLKPDRKEYDRLLVAYLASIENVRKLQDQAATDEYKKGLAQERARVQDLARNKAAVLKGLRAECAKGKGRKLDFEGECYEVKNPFIFAASGESAAIVRTLHAGKLFADIRDVLYILNAGRSANLCKEWVTLIEGVLAQSKRDSDVWRKCMMILFTKGNLRQRYHSIVRRWAMEGQNTWPLSALFFRVDARTGRLTPIVTLENLAMAKEFSKAKYKPGIRVLCARFAVRVHDYDTGQYVCEDLLDQKYKGNTDAGPPEEDNYLSYARHAAMVLMFYGIRNERAFRVVYNRARIVTHEPIPPSGHLADRGGHEEQPKTLKFVQEKFGAYVLGRMEVRQARSLIDRVRQWRP